jgi:hypothetical protein
MCFFCVDCCVDWLFPSWWWSNEFWGTPVVPVPLSTYGAQGAVKYWDEFARQYLGGYGNALRRACTVVYVPYLGCGQVLGLLQYLGGYGTTLRRACTVVYVPYLWYCQVLGIRQYLGGYGTTLPCACTVVYVLYSCCYQVLGVWQYLGGRYGLLQYYLVKQYLQDWGYSTSPIVQSSTRHQPSVIQPKFLRWVPFRGDTSALS